MELFLIRSEPLLLFDEEKLIIEELIFTLDEPFLILDELYLYQVLIIDFWRWVIIIFLKIFAVYHSTLDKIK